MKIIALKIKLTVMLLTFMAVLFMNLPALAAGMTEKPEVMPVMAGQRQAGIIVRFKPGIKRAAADDALKVLGQVNLRYGRSGSILLRPSGDQDAALLLQKLKEDPQVLWAEPEHRKFAQVLPNDTYFSNQWGLQKVKAPEAWALLPEGSAAVTVAVLDTGVDASHEDLAGRVAAGGYNFVDNDTDTSDINGHGTNLAGIIAAATGNGLGIAGVAGNAAVKVLPVKVLNDKGIGGDLDIADGLRYAADNGADVINMSFGGKEYNTELKEALDYAAAKGCLLIAAAGNHLVDTDPLTVLYPAKFENVIAVTAITQQDMLAYFSNYGPETDLAAPGVGIYTTEPGDLYASASGTSMAAPMVSGIAALVKSANHWLNVNQARAVMENTAVDLGTSGQDDSYGKGLVNAGAAVNAALAQLPRGSVRGKVSLEGTGSSSGIRVCLSGTGLETVTDISGAWRISGIPPGQYSIVFQKDGYLRERTENVTVQPGGETTLSAILLKGGDVNGDNRVDMQDLEMLAQNYGQSAALPPYKCSEVLSNGTLGLLDIVLTARNFGQAGI